MTNLIRTSNMRGYKALVTSLGGDPKQLCQPLHIQESIEDETDAFMPFRQLALLLDTAASALSCPDFGLRISAWQGPNILGPIAVVIRSAETVRSAMEDVANYLHIHSPALSFKILSPNQDGNISFVFNINEANVPLAQSYELTIANTVHTLRMLAGDYALPVALYFGHPPLSDPATYQQHLGCPSYFDHEWTGFTLSPSQLDRRIDHADSETHRLAVSYLASFHAPGNHLTPRVIELILALLPTGQCRIDTVADELAMHVRTLQRRLQLEKHSFDELIDQQRQQLAIRYLAERGLHLSQIVGMLGYTEQSSFNRAFRRWYGQTPSAYRLSLSSKDNLLSSNAN